jgi:hypothetical protein
MFVAGYQLGCQVDVSSGVQVGGAGAIAPSASLGATFGAAGVEPGVNAGVGGGLTGYVQTQPTAGSHHRSAGGQYAVGFSRTGDARRD